MFVFLLSFLVAWIAFHFWLMMTLISAVVPAGYCIHRYGRMRVWNWDRELADRASSGTSTSDVSLSLSTAIDSRGDGV